MARICIDPKVRITVLVFRNHIFTIRPLKETVRPLNTTVSTLGMMAWSLKVVKGHTIIPKVVTVVQSCSRIIQLSKKLLKQKSCMYVDGRKPISLCLPQASTKLLGTWCPSVWPHPNTYTRLVCWRSYKTTKRLTSTSSSAWRWAKLPSCLSGTWWTCGDGTSSAARSLRTAGTVPGGTWGEANS